MTRLTGPITYTRVEVADGVQEVYVNARELAEMLDRAGAGQAAETLRLVADFIDDQIAED